MSINENQKEAQIQRLTRFIDSHPDPREMKRAIAVKLALKGYVYKKISEILNVSQPFVSKWKNVFNQSGIEGLKIKYKGAKKKLNIFQEEETIKWILCQEYWDISELEIYLIEEYDVVFKSKESYYKIYKKAKPTKS